MASLRPTTPKPAVPLNPLATTNSVTGDPIRQTGPMPATTLPPVLPPQGALYGPGAPGTWSGPPGTEGPSVLATGGGAMGSLASLSAPHPTPYGDFTAPNPADTANNPYYNFRTQEGEKAIQRSAAARGTLLNGGTLKALEGYRQGLASEAAQQQFDDAMSVYDENRGTNAQNYGQSMGEFTGNLDLEKFHYQQQQDALDRQERNAPATPGTQPISYGVRAPGVGGLADFAAQAQQAQQTLASRPTAVTPTPPKRKFPNWRYMTLADALPGPAFGRG